MISFSRASYTFYTPTLVCTNPIVIIMNAFILIPTDNFSDLRQRRIDHYHVWSNFHDYRRLVCVLTTGLARWHLSFDYLFLSVLRENLQMAILVIRSEHYFNSDN